MLDWGVVWLCVSSSSHMVCFQFWLMLGRRPPVFVCSNGQYLKEPYLAGRLRALPPETEQQPHPLPNAMPPVSVTMPGTTYSDGLPDATVAPLPERIEMGLWWGTWWSWWPRILMHRSVVSRSVPLPKLWRSELPRTLPEKLLPYSDLFSTILSCPWLKKIHSPFWLQNFGCAMYMRNCYMLPHGLTFRLMLNSSLVKIASHVKSKPGDAMNQGDQHTTMTDWLGADCPVDFLNVWFPAHWSPIVLREFHGRVEVP